MICTYIVEIYNEIEGKTELDRGILFADSFTDAITQMETTLYGNELISIKEMDLYDRCCCGFSEELFNQLKEHFNDE